MKAYGKFLNAKWQHCCSPPNGISWQTCSRDYLCTDHLVGGSRNQHDGIRWVFEKVFTRNWNDRPYFGVLSR